MAEHGDWLLRVEAEIDAVVNRGRKNIVLAIEKSCISRRRIGNLELSDIQTISSEEAQLVGDRVCCCLGKSSITERVVLGGCEERTNVNSVEKKMGRKPRTLVFRLDRM